MVGGAGRIGVICDSVAVDNLDPDVGVVGGLSGTAVVWKRLDGLAVVNEVSTV